MIPASPTIFDNIQIAVPKKQGNLGVARAIYEYTKLGYTVLVPLSDSDKYDLVIDNRDQLLRVQVKTTRQKAKRNVQGYTVILATSGGSSKTHQVRHRYDSDYDLLFVLCETGQCWSIPTSKIIARATLNVGSSTCKYTEYIMRV